MIHVVIILFGPKPVPVFKQMFPKILEWLNHFEFNIIKEQITNFDPFWYYSVIESTALLNFKKFQYAFLWLS